MGNQSGSGIAVALHQLHHSGGQLGRQQSMQARSRHAGASSEGFHTHTLPYASAGASFQAGIASGKFHGVISPTTPRGRRRAITRLRPSEGG